MLRDNKNSMDGPKGVTGAQGNTGIQGFQGGLLGSAIVSNDNESNPYKTQTQISKSQSYRAYYE